jgi:pyridoxamine 5'-phosphate oxidase
MAHSSEDSFDENPVESDPLKLFARWFDNARKADLPLAEAMTLATVTPDCRPTARMVLLKQVDERGFVFYTNYNSSKARDLEFNPNAALVFHWTQLEYQVRVEGPVIRTSEEESDAYFQTRPRESQIGAIASPQSEAIPNREWLERRVEEIMTEFGDGPIPRPRNWGGYLLRPERIEFWKARVGRLHDRLLYERRADGTWEVTRLAP